MLVQDQSAFSSSLRIAVRWRRVSGRVGLGSREGRLAQLFWGSLTLCSLTNDEIETCISQWYIYICSFAYPYMMYIYVHNTTHHIGLASINIDATTLLSSTYHATTCHSTPFYSIRLRYITLHALHHVTLLCIALHFITLHCITLHYITYHYMTLHDIT